MEFAGYIKLIFVSPRRRDFQRWLNTVAYNISLFKKELEPVTRRLLDMFSTNWAIQIH